MNENCPEIIKIILAVIKAIADMPQEQRQRGIDLLGKLGQGACPLLQLLLKLFAGMSLTQREELVAELAIMAGETVDVAEYRFVEERA